MPDVATIALFPPPGFIALATAALLGAFGYSRQRRFPAALAMAALSTGLTHLHAVAGNLAEELVPFAVGLATGL